jgi:hypothetical protein
MKTSQTSGNGHNLRASITATILALAAFAAAGDNAAYAGHRTQRVMNDVASGARDFAESPFSGATRTTRLLRRNIRTYDQLGWDLGRELSIRKYGQAGDPGEYPGFNR